MQTAYRIEILDFNGNLVAYSPISRPNITFDYITLTPFEVICAKKIKCNKYDYVFVYEDSKVIFQGIICNITQLKFRTSLYVRPLQALLDNEVVYYISQTHVYSPINSVLTKLRIPNYTIKITAPITNLLIINNQIDNCWEMCLQTLSNFNAFIDMRFDRATKTLEVEVKKCESTKHLECALKNVIDYKLNTDSINAIDVVYFTSEDGSLFAQYGNTVDGKNYKWEIIPSSEVDPFAYSDAKSEQILKETKHSQFIEVSVLKGNYTNYNVCDLVTIQENGQAYETTLTKIEYQNDLKIMTFGYVRENLTDILMLERRKNK